MGKIYLIGYMGSGKSTVGKALAERLDWLFVDLDRLIEIRTGMTISDIFARYGEDIFRELEASALHDTFSRTNTIIATGGGCPCYYDGIGFMKAHGTVIYLKGKPELLASRIGNDETDRPIVAHKSGKKLVAYISLHLKEREQYYKEANVIVDSDQELFEIIEQIAI